MNRRARQHTVFTFIRPGFWVAYRPGAQLKSGDRQVERWHINKKPGGWLAISITRPGLCVAERTLADVRADLASGIFSDLNDIIEAERRGDGAG